MLKSQHKLYQFYTAVNLLCCLLISRGVRWLCLQTFQCRSNLDWSLLMQLGRVVAVYTYSCFLISVFDVVTS